MSRRSPILEKESRLSFSPASRMTPVYLAVFVFTLLAVALSLAIVPGGLTLTRLSGIMSERPFLHWLGNVALVALTVSITGVALASIVGYALSRLRVRDYSVTSNSLLIPQIIAAVVLLLPLYLIVIKVGLIGFLLAIILFYCATALPFCVWQMKAYYEVIPLSIEEAATIEGASRWQSFRLIFVPLATPALISSGLFSLMTGWNESVIAAVALDRGKIFGSFASLNAAGITSDAQWALYAAGALLVSIPIVILFLVLSRFPVSA